MPASIRPLLVAFAALLAVVGCSSAIAPPHPLLAHRLETPVVARADSSMDLQARQLLLRGLTHARNGDHERALEFYRQALEAAPGAPAVLSAIATAYEAADDLPSALLYAQQAARAAPEHAAYGLHLAQLAAQLGRPQVREAALDRLLSDHPNDPAVLRAALLEHLEADRPARAVSLAARLAEARPAWVPWTRLLPHLDAEHYAALRERGLRTLVLLHPDRPDAYVQLGRFLAERDRTEEARAVLESGRLHTGGSDSLRLLLAETGGDAVAGATADRADEQIARASRLVAEAPSADDRAAARTLLDEALAERPDDVDALALAGRLAAEAGEHQHAADLLARAVALDPRRADLWERAARAHLDAGDPDAAFAMGDEALLLFPGRPALLAARARAHLALDRPADALDDAERAADRLREDQADAERAAVLVILGEARLRTGNAAGAREAWERALQWTPDDAALRRRLAQL